MIWLFRLLDCKIVQFGIVGAAFFPGIKNVLKFMDFNRIFIPSIVSIYPREKKTTKTIGVVPVGGSFFTIFFFS